MKPLAFVADAGYTTAMSLVWALDFLPSRLLGGWLGRSFADGRQGCSRQPAGGRKLLAEAFRMRFAVVGQSSATIGSSSEQSRQTTSNHPSPHSNPRASAQVAISGRSTIPAASAPLNTLRRVQEIQHRCSLAFVTSPPVSGAGLVSKPCGFPTQ